MSNETLEEAAKKHVDLPLNKEMDENERYFNTKHREYDSFIAGAKWQAERMYSEEEMKSAFNVGFGMGYGSPVLDLDIKENLCEKWFKQVKKK